MSADNFIGVYQHGDEWVVSHGFASDGGDNAWGSERSRHPSREAALVAAHDEYARESIVEYGVIELGERK